MAADPRPDVAEGAWVFHDGPGPHSGWLYQYADGTWVTEDGTVLEHDEGATVVPPAEPDPLPGPEPVPAPVPAPAPVPRPEPQPEPVPDPPPVPEPEPAAAAEPEPAPEPEPEPKAVPAYLRWQTSATPQYLAGLVFLAAAIGAVLLAVTALADADTGRLTTAAGLALLAGAALYGVTALVPTVVTIRDATVVVAHGEHEKTFDLADPETRVRLGEKPRSAAWQATLRSPSGDAVVLRRTQVQPRRFSDVVRHHRERSATGGD